MKSKEREEARELRFRGNSISDITKALGVAKSSISLWVRDIKLTKKQKHFLSQKGTLLDIVEKRRGTRLANEDAKRQVIIDQAQNEVIPFDKKELWLMGTVLYWAEGGKANRGSVNFSNSDPNMIKFIMAYFRKICLVEEKKFRCHIHTYSHLNSQVAEKYWAGITKIPLNQFYKTYVKRTKSGIHKRDKLPYGTLSIYICRTELYLKILGWVTGIFKFTDNHL